MKKGKAAKKAAIAVVTAVAVGGVSVGGYYGIRQAQKTTVKVYPVSDFTSGYWGDSMNMEGQITSTASQNIYLSDSQTISQVLVKEGDVVNAGDTLMTYDTSMIELDLETQQLQLAQTKLKIQQSEKELEKLKKTKPVSDTPLNPVEPDFPDFPDFPDEPIDPDFPDEPIPTPEPEPTYEDAVLYSSTNKLVFGSKPYKGEGTQEDPYTYLCAPGTVLTGGFLNQMAGYADEKGTKKEEDSEGYWFRLEIHEENKAAEALETVWEQDGTKIAKAYETSYEAVLSLKESESADAPEIKITTPLANTEVAEGGELKLKIGINEKKDTEEKPDEKADDKTDDRTESLSEDDVTQPGEAGNGSGEADDSTENTETDVTYTYVWKHNGKTIDGDFKDTYTKENITKEDAGIYTVEVTAKNDKGTSMAVSTANVTVKEGTITPAPSVTPTPGVTPGPSVTPEPTVSPEPSTTPIPTTEPVPTETPVPSETPVPTETPTPTEAPAEPEAEPQSEDAKEAVQTTAKTVFYGEKASVQSLFTSSTGSSANNNTSSGDDTQMTYTKDELKKAISEKESQIRNLKLDQKEEELKVKNTQKSLDSQTVKATISGVVKKVGNAENPSNDGSAFIQVSGNEGLYVRGYLSETYLDQVKVGDELNVTSWSSGAFAAATVTEISPYPTTSYMSYSETPASFYPFTAVIPEGGEGFENGDWIEIAITVGNDVENGNGLYVSKEFIREENGQKFVYIRDENDKLKKQNVVTGKLLWGSYYEVKSGLSEEDYIAFPYGKTVVEGADTKESSSSDYYNS